MALVSLFSYEESFARSIQLPKCNREACHERFAPCFNTGTKTYYCVRCAVAINRANPEAPDLCEIPDFDTEVAMFEKYEDGEQYVGTSRLEDHPELLKTGWTADEFDGPAAQIRKAILAKKIVPVKGGVRKGDIVVVGATTMRGKSMFSGIVGEHDRAISCPVMPGRVTKKVFLNARVAGKPSILSMGEAAYSKVLTQIQKLAKLEHEAELERIAKLTRIRKYLNRRKKQARARTGRK